MVSKVTGADDEGSGLRGETFSLFRDTICSNLDKFFEEYDKKKAERDPKFQPIDDDFFESFFDSRDKELATIAWNALGESAQKSFDEKILADAELKNWCVNNGGIGGLK